MDLNTALLRVVFQYVKRRHQTLHCILLTDPTSMAGLQLHLHEWITKIYAKMIPYFTRTQGVFDSCTRNLEKRNNCGQEWHELDVFVKCAYTTILFCESNL